MPKQVSKKISKSKSLSKGSKSNQFHESINSSSLIGKFALILSQEIVKGDLSSETYKNYNYQFQSFVKWCNQNQVRLDWLSENDIKQYRDYLIARNLNPKTIALKLGVIRKICERAVIRGLLHSNPALKVKAPKIENSLVNKNYLELEEVKQLIETLPNGNSLLELRNRLLIVLMLIQGCSLIELYRLNIRDLIPSGVARFQLRLNSQKGKSRIIPLKKDIAVLLERYLQVRKNNGENLKETSPMFISLASNQTEWRENRLTRRSMQVLVNSCLVASGLKRSKNSIITASGLRNTAGYLLYQNGQPIEVVQNFLGLSDRSPTPIYAQKSNCALDDPFDRLGIDI